MSRRVPSEWCCLHETCPVIDCPEPVCAMEFPGGIAAYIRAKEIRDAVEGAKDIAEAAKSLNISESAAQRRYNKTVTA
jgi:hypothetical protein